MLEMLSGKKTPLRSYKRTEGQVWKWTNGNEKKETQRENCEKQCLTEHVP